MDHSQTKSRIIGDSVRSLEVGDYIDIKKFIKKLWGNYDYFIRRSFDVLSNKPRKECFPKLFKVENSRLYRVL